MKYKSINPIVSWWMTPKLPPQDVYELPLLKDKTVYAKFVHLISQWLVHPIKRRLARAYLKYLKQSTHIKVIGVTGSAGKSTTVSILSSILNLDGETVSTPHSIDPVYNIPNTILKCRSSTRYLVLEMSVEYPGEMDYYLWLATPDVGIITNIYPTHLAHFGDVSGVLREKSKLVKELSKSGTAILNKDDAMLRKIRPEIEAKVVWFSQGKDLKAADINAARLAAQTLGVSRKRTLNGIRRAVLPGHRLEIVQGIGGTKIFDDSYNSNPGAIASSLMYFDKLSKGMKKIAVIGDMLELGKLDKISHIELGRVISKMNFSVVIGVGKSVETTLKEIGKRVPTITLCMCKDVNEAATVIRPYLTGGVFIFVKGSRSIGLDNLVSVLSGKS